MSDNELVLDGFNGHDGRKKSITIQEGQTRKNLKIQPEQQAMVIY